MKPKRWIVLALFLAGALTLGATVLAQDSSTVDQWVIAGGGSISYSEGGSVALNDTLGQPLAAPAGAGAIHLEMGYWHTAEYEIYLPLVLRNG